jgi:chorismate mutase
MSNPVMVASMVSMFAAMLEPVVPELVSVAGMSPDEATAISNALTDLQEASQAFAQADTAAPQDDLITRVETDAEAVLTALAAAPLPGWLSMPVRAAQMMLPSILMLIKMVFPVKAPTPAVAQPAADPPPATA